MKQIRRWALLPIVVLLALAAMVGLVQQVRAADNFSPPPYAASREEAMRGRERAFLAMDLPISVVLRMSRVTNRPGEMVRVVAGYHFEAMVWVDSVVRHDVIMIPRESFVPAERWEITLMEETLEIFLISLPDFFTWGIKRSSYTTALAHSTPVERIPTNT